MENFSGEFDSSCLRELAENIAWRDMEAIALQYLSFEAAKIRNLSDASRDDREKFNFELLNLWSRKMGNNKEVKYQRVE